MTNPPCTVEVEKAFKAFIRDSSKRQAFRLALDLYSKAVTAFCGGDRYSENPIKREQIEQAIENCTFYDEVISNQ